MLKAYWNLESVPLDFPPSAVTIGNFDGVHVGHQKILNVTVERARSHGWQAAALTFDPHPMRVVAPERAPALLTLPAQRLRRFSEWGMDVAVVLPFTSEVACLSPQQFVEQVLVAKLHVQWVVVGHSFRFGHQQLGDLETLAQLGKRYGFQVEAVPAVLIGSKPVSSTRIRTLVGQGRIEQVRRLLGRPYALEGPIVPGQGVGSRQTVPTLNLAPETTLLPARGVYVTATYEPASGRRWESVTNVGNRPTFDGAEQTVETFLLSRLDSEPPQRIQLAFYRRLRDEKRFDSPERLREQILLDAAKAGQFFRRLQAAGRRKATIS